MNKRLKKKLQSVKNPNTFYIAYTDPDFEMCPDNMFITGYKYKSKKDFEAQNEGMKAIKLIKNSKEYISWFNNYFKNFERTV